MISIGHNVQYSTITLLFSRKIQSRRSRDDMALRETKRDGNILGVPGIPDSTRAHGFHPI